MIVAVGKGLTVTVTGVVVLLPNIAALEILLSIVVPSAFKNKAAKEPDVLAV